MLFYSNKFYTPSGFQSGYLRVENGKIKEILQSSAGKSVIDYSDKIIVPGFIDIHVHGWATGSYIHQGNKRSLEKMSADMVHMGVTSYLATTVTEHIDKLKKQVSNAQEYMNEWDPTMGSEVLGVHLEGPFINEEYKGMQKAEYCLSPSIEITDSLLNQAESGTVKLMTLAPELEGMEEVIQYLNQKKFKYLLDTVLQNLKKSHN